MEGLFELVFVALALLGWIIKTAQEERERRKQQQAPGEPPPEVEDLEEEGVVFEREAPPAPRRTPAPGAPERSAPAPRRESAPQAEREQAARRDASMPRTVTRERLGAKAIGGGKPLSEIAAPLAVTGRRHDRRAGAHGSREDRAAARRAALRRLGADRLPAGHHLVGLGVLWREVLGPPRALAGPHRPPTVERRGRSDRVRVPVGPASKPKPS